MVLLYVNGLPNYYYYVVPLVLDSLHDLCCIEPIAVHTPVIIRYNHVIDQLLDMSRAKRAIECLWWL